MMRLPSSTSESPLPPACCFTSTADQQACVTRPKARGQSKKLQGVLLLLLLASTSGCVGMRDRLMYSHGFDKFIIGHRNHLLAKRAWRRSHHFGCESKHFRQGYLDGYMGVTWGGDGCLPPTAPRKYWGWRYQNPAGQAEIAEWFAGYPEGANAALQEGVRTWGQVGALQEGDGCVGCQDSELGESPEGYVPGMSPPGTPWEELPPERGQRLDESPSNLPRSVIPSFEPMPDQSAMHRPNGSLQNASQAGLNASDPGASSDSDMFVLLSDLPSETAPASERRWPSKKPMVVAEEQTE